MATTDQLGELLLELFALRPGVVIHPTRGKHLGGRLDFVRGKRRPRRPIGRAYGHAAVDGKLW